MGLSSSQRENKIDLDQILHLYQPAAFEFFLQVDFLENKIDLDQVATAFQRGLLSDPLALWYFEHFRCVLHTGTRMQPCAVLVSCCTCAQLHIHV